jgi:uncharacterized protein YkwD
MPSKLGALARGVALGSILALALGCTGGQAGHVAGGGKSASRAPARKADLPGIEREVLTRVNRYRRAEGLPALASDARIAEIARGHSRSMAAGKTGFGHGGWKGRTRLVAGKLPYKRVAENVSRHSRDPRQIPAVAVEGWVDSRGHRRNIEGPFALTGVGAAVGPDGSVYLTQIFVLPR